MYTCSPAHTEMSLFQNLAPYSCPLNNYNVIIDCHCAVPGYIFVFSVNRQIACRRKLRASHWFRILLFIFSLWSEWLPSAIFLLLFLSLIISLTMLSSSSAPSHLPCWATLLTHKALQLQNFPLLWLHWQLFFQSFQTLCGEFWSISNIISKLIFFKWNFSAVFKSKFNYDQKILLSKSCLSFFSVLAFIWKMIWPSQNV